MSSFETAFSHKRVIIEGMTLFTDIFRISPFSGHCAESNYRSAVEDLVSLEMKNCSAGFV